MSGGDTTDSATNALNSDARPAFVTPRDLLQRAPLPQKESPRQLSAIDREQLDGLVRQGLYCA
jgi:5'-AMP-activated protein kinase regulatory gamma subunit